MDYKKFAKQLRNQAGSYALFYGAPRGDLEKAADVIEELAARLEPSSTPLTLDELREMDGEPVWVEFSDSSHLENRWCLVMLDRQMNAIRLWDNNGNWYDTRRKYRKTWLAYRRRPEALGGEAAPALSRPKAGPRDGKT